MARREIHFTVGTDGKIEFTIQGMKGQSCEDLAKALSELGEVEEKQRTGEYYEKPTTGLDLRAGTGGGSPE